MLAKRCAKALWPDAPQNSLTELRFQPMARDDASPPRPLRIADTPSLQNALKRFRDTYDLRRAVAIQRAIGDVEDLLARGEPTHASRAAKKVQEMMQLALDPDTHGKLAALLAQSLGTKTARDSDAKHGLEKAAVAALKAGLRRPDELGGVDEALVAALVRTPAPETKRSSRRSRDRRDEEPEALTKPGVEAFAALAADDRGASLLLKPPTFATLLRRLLATPDQIVAGDGAKCILLAAHRGRENWRLDALGVKLLAQTLRAATSWEARRCAAATLAMVARAVREGVEDAPPPAPDSETDEETDEEPDDGSAQEDDRLDHAAEKDDAALRAFARARVDANASPETDGCFAKDQWKRFLRDGDVFRSALARGGRAG